MLYVKGDYWLHWQAPWSVPLLPATLQSRMHHLSCQGRLLVHVTRPSDTAMTALGICNTKNLDCHHGSDTTFSLSH